MKRYILNIFLLVPFQFIFGQTYKYFDCGLFSFDYPSVFKTTPIQNAPHMVLKLESDNYIFSASYWDKGFEKIKLRLLSYFSNKASPHSPTR